MSVNAHEPSTGRYPPAVASPWVNGRGVRREGKTTSPGGRTVVSAADVSNQATSTTKD